VRSQFDRRSTAAGASTLFIVNAALAATVMTYALALPFGVVMAQGARDRPLIHFDIPAQPLGSALERYGDATGREVLYDDTVGADRRSAPVAGAMTAEAAIDALLQGTGLAARFMADGTFALVPLAVTSRYETAAEAALRRQYYLRIRYSLRDALCAMPETRPGTYRLTALFWIGNTGQVARYERLASTGLPTRDRTVDLTLQRLAIGAPPPSGFEQPVLIMVSPERPGITADCEDTTLRVHRP